MSQRMKYRDYILASIRNKPGRNLATVFCFAFIAMNIFAGQYLLAGAAGSLDRSVSRMGADHLVVPLDYLSLYGSAGSDKTMAIIHVEPSLYRMDSSTVDHIGLIQGVARTSPQLYVTTVRAPGLSASPVQIYGFDPATDFTIRPWVRQPYRASLQSGQVIVGSEVKGDVSSRISLFGHIYMIAGRLDPTRSTADHAIFLAMDDAYALAATEGALPDAAPRITPGKISAIVVGIDGGENIDMTEIRMRRSLPSDIVVIARHFALTPAVQEVRGLPDLLNTLSIVVVVAAFPLIALVAAMVARERKREIGLLKSMGATRSIVIFLTMAESLLLALCGGITGVGVGFFAFTALNAQGLLDSALAVSFRAPQISETGFMALTAVLTVVAIGGASALYPAYANGTTNPYDAIRCEG